MPRCSSAELQDFDVVVTENLFGDILATACHVTGSIGMPQSASLGMIGMANIVSAYTNQAEIGTGHCRLGIANPIAQVLWYDAAAPSVG
jgi:isocitrate/isopropylmalate dehydrogenase